ncbi:MAG TPA: GntP family permease, partial [Patescibacteria group bacterium]|nr:GntP family permease [Patescibacteria group bacterium]
FLVTGAGGSFGNIINTSGIGKYLVDTMQGWSISILVLGFLLSQLLRAAQGSTTVALVTTSSILGPLVAGTTASPVLVALAICAGGIGCSLPNDSGFWVLSRYSGLSVQDTIKAWTIGGTVVGITAFAIVMLLSAMPFLPGL